MSFLLAKGSRIIIPNDALKEVSTSAERDAATAVVYRLRCSGKNGYEFRIEGDESTGGLALFGPDNEGRDLEVVVDWVAVSCARVTLPKPIRVKAPKFTLEVGKIIVVPDFALSGVPSRNVAEYPETPWVYFLDLRDDGVIPEPPVVSFRRAKPGKVEGSEFQLFGPRALAPGEKLLVLAVYDNNAVARRATADEIQGATATGHASSLTV